MKILTDLGSWDFSWSGPPPPPKGYRLVTKNDALGFQQSENGKQQYRALIKYKSTLEQSGDFFISFSNALSSVQSKYRELQKLQQQMKDLRGIATTFPFSSSLSLFKGQPFRTFRILLQNPIFSRAVCETALLF